LGGWDVGVAGARDPGARGHQAAPERLLDDDRLLAARVRGAPRRDLRSVRRPAGERAGRLDHLEDEIPLVEGQKIVAISDNLSTRGTEEVEQWLNDHPRWSFQFTPKHASWLNQVEIFFSILWRRLLKHGIFTSEDDLAQQMLAFVETYNQTAKPFKWTYTGKVVEA